jgi:hypothetical protein
MTPSAGGGTEGATSSSAMCRYQHYFMEKMLESYDFPEFLTDVYQFATTSVSLHVVVACPNFVSLKQVLLLMNYLWECIVKSDLLMYVSLPRLQFNINLSKEGRSTIVSLFVTNKW